MHFLTTLATLLLSLSGYSLGVVLRSGKSGTRKPVGLDLGLVILMWAGIVFSMSRTALSRWTWLPAGIAAGLVLGWAVTAIRGYSEAEQASAVEPRPVHKHAEFKRWPAYREFSFKLGTFQSQVLLGLLDLIGFGLVGLAVRLFSDPLRIKRSSPGSHWTPRPEIPPDLELFKRQS